MASNATFSLLTQCQHVPTENEEKCQEDQYAICPHCNLWLCGSHILDHQQRVQAKAHMINDEANQLRQQLDDLSVGDLHEHCQQKIDEWRDRMYAEIAGRHAEMLKQLNKLHDELIEEVNNFKKYKIDSFSHEIAEPIIHMLTKQKQIHPAKLDAIETKVNQLKETIECIGDPDLICMNCDDINVQGEIKFTRKHPCEESDEESEDLQTFDLAIIQRAATLHFPLKTTSIALAASAHLMLAFEEPSTLVLFDTKNELRRIDTENMSVYDMCWSETLKMFLIAGSIFQTYDVLSNTLSYQFLKHENYTTYMQSVTAHHNDMFLLWNEEDMIKRYSLPSFNETIKWPSNIYLEQNNDIEARCIRMNNNGVLAMTILQKDLRWRVDLFDAQMQRSRRGAPFTEIGEDEMWHCQFCPIARNQWLVTKNNSSPQMVSILDAEGNIKDEIVKNGFNVVLVGTEYVVLRDTKGLHLYQI